MTLCKPLQVGARQLQGELQEAPALIVKGQPLVLIAQSTIQLNGAELVGARQL